MIPQRSATKRTSVSDWCVFKLSTTKCQADASGSVSTVYAICTAKSSSVRVGPADGATTCPLTTSRLSMKDAVPCRMYSYSRRRTRPGAVGRSGCVGSSACTPVSSSVLMMCSPRAARSGAS